MRADRASRRGLLVATAAAAMGMAGAAQGRPITVIPSDDADANLLRLCAEHVATHDAYLHLGGQAEIEDDPLFAPYERTLVAISEAEPQTMAGLLAKARVAKLEAALPNGGEEADSSVAATWAWDLVGDLLRLYGGGA